MTEKRFWSEDYSVGYYTEIIDNEKELKDIPNPKKNLTIEEVVDLLNKLLEENKQLKQERKLIQKDIGQVLLIFLDDEIRSKLSKVELESLGRLSKY